MIPNSLLTTLVTCHPTPFWVYDADSIRRRIIQLTSFDTIRFAQKTCSNIHILQLMRENGVLVDAVSHGEIERALKAGYQNCPDQRDDSIVFTADIIDNDTLKRVVTENIPVNAGSIDMLSQVGCVSPGHRVWLRINPGFGHGHSQKTNTGGEMSKHGIWHADLPQALAVIQQHQLKLVGLHMHIGSGVDYQHLARVCDAMVHHAINLGHDFEAISAGGGLSVPYRTGEPEIDTEHYFNLWDRARQKIAAYLGHAIRLEIEPGRFLVADAGALISKVYAVKTMGRNHFVLVDAGFNDLMRPTLYGSYHHITVLPCQPQKQIDKEILTIVAGPLCESGDVFTQQEGSLVVPRPLPAVDVGDYVIFHDTGAYGASMSSNYNTRPLLAEIMVDRGQARLIRRQQRIDELLQLEEVDQQVLAKTRSSRAQR